MEKERRTKALLLSTLVVVVATLSIAFAAMSRTLSINGIGKMDTASWSVYFDNLSNAKITRGAEEVGKPKISDDKGIVQDINVKLSNPKDEISYTVDIVNDGTIDAEITMIKDIELTEVQKKVFEFKVTYTDTGEVLKDGDLLPKKTTKNITINIKFKDDITEFDLPTESQTINLSYQITYTQSDGGNIPIIPDGGDITTGKAILAKGLSFEEKLELEDLFLAPFLNSTSITSAQVESIDFLNNNEVPTEYASTSWDASQNGDGSIMAWYTDSDNNELYEVYIGGNGGVAAPSDSSGLFAVFMSLKNINFNNNFDTSNVTNMSYMFAVNVSLENLDLSTFNTEKVTNMEWMFEECFVLKDLDLSSFNTSNVTDMGRMFQSDSSLTNLDLSSFDTRNVTDMTYLFSGCGVLTTLNLSSFNTSNVTTMHSMFINCTSLTSLDLSSFNTSNVTDMSSMFGNCESLTNLDLSSFDTRNVTDMTYMFSSCSSLTSLDLSSFDTRNVTDMTYMFSSCSSLTSLDLSSFDTSNATNMEDMFNYCSSLTSLDLSSFNTSNVTTMQSMFINCTSLTSLDLSSFDTTNVISMREMFYRCRKLTNLDLSSFNTSNVTDMIYMFSGCESLTSIDLRKADFSNVTSISDLCISRSTQVIVKDETQRTLLLNLCSYLTNVVLPSEL